MADARFNFTIARQLEEVFAVLTDPEKTRNGRRRPLRSTGSRQARPPSAQEGLP